MDVNLLVYDLSRGLAKQMSMGMLGFQLDAIYHTSIELQGREYVYDGGIMDIVPGSSHHGQPMQRLLLGQTNLPMDVIHDYLDSLRPIFTVEAYDLFKHNCNNFTDTFSNFLTGKGIPNHISSMPQAVMDSPLGRMLLPQLTQSVNSARQNGSFTNTSQNSYNAATSGNTGGVINVTQSSQLTQALNDAKQSAAIIFFTSATCPPCKMLYPVYDELARELAGKVIFIKVDISNHGVADVSARYSVRATPTFVTYLKGEELERWSGADSAKLRGNATLLVAMASPTHLHDKLRLPSFANANARPSLYNKTPPLAKVVAKMDPAIANHDTTKSLLTFLEQKETSAQDAVLPTMGELAAYLCSVTRTTPPTQLFGLIDLFRASLADPRISGYFAEEQDHKTLQQIVEVVIKGTDCPYAFRLVSLQMMCNMFSTPLFISTFLANDSLRQNITSLISSSFLDDNHSNTRVAASSLLFNVSLGQRQSRLKKSTGLPEAEEVELAASVVEAIDQEKESPEALHGMLLALGNLVYGSELDGELADLLRALAAEDTILNKKAVFPKEPLIQEVGLELLGKGLRKP